MTRGGVISVIYKTQLLGLSETSWGREMESQSHILRCWAGTPGQYHQTTNRVSAECASVRHGGSFLWVKTNILEPSYACVTRIEWIRRLRETISPPEARLWNFGTMTTMDCGGVGTSARVRLIQ